MAKTIVTLCDPCLIDGKETSGQTWAITLAEPGGKPRPYEIDVCEMHAEPYVILARHLADDARRSDRKQPVPGVLGTVPGAASAPGPKGSADMTACPVSGCGFVSTTHGGLKSHLKSAHNTSLAEVTGQAPIQCPECPRRVGAVQGLMAHLRTAHGMDREAARDAAAGAGHPVSGRK